MPTDPAPQGAKPPGFGPAVLVRIFILHQRLCQGARMTAPALAKATGVDKRTSLRDIAILRDDLGAPLDWDEVGGTWYYTHTCDSLPFVKFSPEEAFAVGALAYSAAGAEGASASLASAIEKLTPLVGGIVSFPLKELGAVVSAPAADGEFRFAELLMHAALHRRELRVTYQRPTPGAEIKEHVVHPLLLAPLDHKWTLIARVSGKKTIKHFLFARMREVAATGKTFERPADFDPKKYLAGSIGRFAGKQDIEVRLAFSAEVAGYAREEFRRHPSAQWELRPDGRTGLTLRVNSLPDIKNRIMGYGDHVEVLAPENLRAKVRDAHKAALAQYE